MRSSQDGSVVSSSSITWAGGGQGSESVVGLMVVCQAPGRRAPAQPVGAGEGCAGESPTARQGLPWRLAGWWAPEPTSRQVSERTWAREYRALSSSSSLACGGGVEGRVWLNGGAACQAAVARNRRARVRWRSRHRGAGWRRRRGRALDTLLHMMPSSRFMRTCPGRGCGRPPVRGACSNPAIRTYNPHFKKTGIPEG